MCDRSGTRFYFLSALQAFVMHLRFRQLLLGSVLILSACGETPPPPAAAEPVFVGSAECNDCHVVQYSDWANSHHDLAMQVANASTVLGDFENASFNYFDTETEFLVRDELFIVRTANAVGEPEDFPIAYTFGVAPLQQYLVEFPDGRLQALPFAWDTRSANDGGKQWFHLYPDEYIGPGDALHWTGRQQNWNYMCAECHSTNYQVNYDLATDHFESTWSEIDVGCEACHGPASVHVAEARTGEFSGDWGLSVDLDDHGRSVWQMNLQTGIAERSELAMRQSKQPEACGRCHARRGVISPTYEYGKPLAETHRVALLDTPLYFDDGQIRNEVYVYGSFVQSRMYRAGVTCSDCHNPHSLELVTGPEPSDVCTQCHLPDTFASTEHHNHEPDDVACVDCHMPSRDYMVVDPRRDHSFRVPLPELSVSIDSPNVCASCHDYDARPGAVESPHFGSAFNGARNGIPSAPLASVIGDGEVPGIARATALRLLSGPLVSKDAAAIQLALSDTDALVRMAALQSSRMLSPDTQLQLAAPLLKDSDRSVRIEAASLLSPFSGDLPSTSGFAEAAEEFRAAQLAIASRPEAHTSLGDFSAAMGDVDQAIDHYKTALRIDPADSMSRLNYADALRGFGDERGAELLLRDGLVLSAANAEIRHSLGLLLVRSNRPVDGLAELREAARLSPQNARFVYVEGIALNSLGQSDAAIEVLEDAHRRFGRDFDIAWALATMLRDRGDTARAREVVEMLASHRPDDPNVAALLESLTVP